MNRKAFFTFRDLARRPVPGLRTAGRAKEPREVFVRDFVFIHIERVDVHLVRGQIIAAIAFEPADLIDEEIVDPAHPELAGGDRCHTLGRSLQCQKKQERDHCSISSASSFNI